MDLVHGVVHGPGPWGGQWIPIHVLYTTKRKAQNFASWMLSEYAFKGLFQDYSGWWTFDRL